MARELLAIRRAEGQAAPEVVGGGHQGNELNAWDRQALSPASGRFMESGLRSHSLPSGRSSGDQREIKAQQGSFAERLLDDPVAALMQRARLGWEELREVLAAAFFGGEQYHAENFLHREVYRIPTTAHDTSGAQKLRALRASGYIELPPIEMHALSFLPPEIDRPGAMTKAEGIEAIVVALRMLGLDAVGFTISSGRLDDCQWLILTKPNVNKNSRTN